MSIQGLGAPGVVQGHVVGRNFQPPSRFVAVGAQGQKGGKTPRAGGGFHVAPAGRDEVALTGTGPRSISGPAETALVAGTAGGVSPGKQFCGQPATSGVTRNYPETNRFRGKGRALPLNRRRNRLPLNVGASAAQAAPIFLAGN